MMIYDGSLVLLGLKIKNDYQLVGGMYTTKFELNNQLIKANNISSNNWRELLNNSGIRYLNITVSGVFSNSESEQAIKKLAFSGDLAEYKISFQSQESLVGKFKIKYYERIGSINEEEHYMIGLASSGTILTFS